MRVGSVRDELFLLAHDDDGRLIGSEPSVSAGLAGAMLIDLLLTSRVAVVAGRLTVVDSATTGDAEADATLAAVAGNAQPTGPRAWVSWISAGAYDRTGAVLEAAGVVQRNTARRLGVLQATRCVPANTDDLVRLRSRLRYGVHTPGTPDFATAALCGLVRVLRLQSALLLSMPTAELLDALEKMASGSPTTIRQIINAVDAVVSASAYR